MRRFGENKIEQGNKNIYWRIDLNGTIPADTLLDLGAIHEILGNVAYEASAALYGSGPDDFNEYDILEVDIPYYDFKVDIVVNGWHSLSFGAQSVIYISIAEAIEEGDIEGSFMVPDYFDEDYE